MRHCRVGHFLILVIVLPWGLVAAASGKSPNQTTTTTTTNTTSTAVPTAACSRHHPIILVYIMATEGALGVLVNLLVLAATFTRSGSGRSSSYLFANLAFVDAVLSAMMIYPAVLELTSPCPQMNHVMCFGWLNMLMMFGASSIYTVTAISLDRYMGILHPLHRTSFIKSHGFSRVIAGVWLSSLLVSMPVWSGILHAHFMQGIGLLECELREPLWYVILSVFLVFLVPFCIMSESYRRVHHRIRVRSRMMALGGLSFTKTGDVRGQRLRVHRGTRIISESPKRESIMSPLGRLTESSGPNCRKKSITSADTMPTSHTLPRSNVPLIYLQDTPPICYSASRILPVGHRSSQADVTEDTVTENQAAQDDFKANEADRTEGSTLKGRSTRSTVENVHHGLEVLSRQSSTIQTWYDRKTQSKRSITSERSHVGFPPLQRSSWLEMHVAVTKGCCRGKIKTTVTLVLIITLFLVFWLPFFALLPLCHLLTLEREDWGDRRWCMRSQCWALLHSLVNPFLYIWPRADYRRAVKNLMRCKRKRSGVHSNIVMLMARASSPSFFHSAHYVRETEWRVKGDEPLARELSEVQ
ncbi:hypothetical protein ACOMHN_015533 [Nucella lapillus]